MTDYKELIAELKKEWKACDSLISDKIAINLGKHTEKRYVILAENCCHEMVGIMSTIYCAIDAIEQLVTDIDVARKERDELVGKIDKLEKERDAAIADLEGIVADSEIDIDPCYYCKYAEEDGQCFHECNPFSGKWGWEWRGVPEDNDEIN